MVLSEGSNPQVWRALIGLVGLTLGLLLHLHWHPLREPVRQAWGLLKSWWWPVLLLTLVLLLGESTTHTLVAAPPAALASFEAAVLELGPRAGMDFLLLSHAFLPGWPLAVLLPLTVGWGAWRNRRQGGRVLLPAGIVLLGSSAWGAMEVLAVFERLPAEALGQPLRAGLRLAAEAITLAGLQLLLICGTLLRVLPQPRRRRAISDRWQTLDALMGHGGAWLLVASLEGAWLAAMRAGLPPAVGWAWLAVLLPVPLVAACGGEGRGGWVAQVRLLGRIHRRAAVSLLGLALTALPLLWLARYTGAQGLALADSDAFLQVLARLLAALVLATVHGWVFLALVLTLFHQGYQPALRSAGGRSAAS